MVVVSHPSPSPGVPPRSATRSDSRLPTAEAVLARAGTENFPVATRLLPTRLRRDLLALYGYARLVDETGDAADGDRDALLDELETDLNRVFSGTPHHPLLRTLQVTVREHRVPRAPLARLIEANRVDQRVTHYVSFDQLRGYCALSADPVGQLVLHVVGRATPERIAASDRICTALQVLEHCQDVGEDHGAGRIYLPARDRARHGCPDADLAAATASPALRRVIADQVARARDLLAEGETLVTDVGWPARIAVAGFVAGGWATAHALVAAGHDVLAHPVRPRRLRLLAGWVRLMLIRGPSRTRRAGTAAPADGATPMEENG